MSKDVKGALIDRRLGLRCGSEKAEEEADDEGEAEGVRVGGLDLLQCYKPRGHWGFAFLRCYVSRYRTLRVLHGCGVERGGWEVERGTRIADGHMPSGPAGIPPKCNGSNASSGTSGT